MADILNNPIFTRPQNRNLGWSAVLVKELHQCGLRHAVISPGSRSTPLALAFAWHPGIEKHVVLDERSAGFFALGIGMESALPAALVCTSGTAVANYTPSVIESKMAQIPLLVLTADRPPFQRDIGANQTIRQGGLFGENALYSYDTGEPILHHNDLDRLKILANQIWHESTGNGGPVHVNLPFRKPLEPDPEAVELLYEYYRGDGMSQQPFTQTLSKVTWEIPDEIQLLLESSNKPVVIASSVAGQQFFEKITRYFINQNFPVLAEPGSLRNFSDVSKAPVAGAANFLKSETLRTNLIPDLIIRIGSEPLAKGLELFIQTHKTVKQIRFESTRKWSDANLTGGIRIEVPRNALLKIPPSKGTNTSVRIAWNQKWLEHSRDWIQLRAKSAVSDGELRDGDVWRTVLPTLESPHNIMVSNSFPARDADTFGVPEIFGHNVYMNRGASGIDGITSTALGIAHSGTNPVILFTGDLAFLHDSGGLINHKDIRSRFQIIVIDNGGGSIFRMLPIYQKSDWFTHYFETPQKADLIKLAEAFGYETSEASCIESLKSALFSLKNHIRSVIICKTSSEASMKQRSDVWKEPNLS
jgi:2-succinyl-5-enolpyruvyl-6-hydroxy-3-cyclohexene-1-carboxylate synthase